MTSQNQNFQRITLNQVTDERGSLCVIEGCKDIPFAIARAYYLFGLDSESPRGFHAHRKLRQFAICLSGSVDILMDDGSNREVISLSSPSTGLMIEPMQWHEMQNFSEGCVLLVLASDVYDEADYIRDYVEFEALVNK